MTEAKRVRIAIGSLEFDGYMVLGQMDEDGLPVFGFNLTQAALMLGLTDQSKQAMQYVLTISRGKFAQTHFPQGFDVLTKIKATGVDGQKNTLTILPIAGFERLSLCAAVAGKAQAVEIQCALAGYSLRKIFSRHFDEVFTDEDAERHMAARFQGIEVRNQWTDQIKLWLTSPKASDNDRKFTYANTSDRLNVALTGHKSKHWCEKLGCTSGTLRDFWDDRHLAQIAAIENHAAVVLRKTECKPMEALEQAIEFHEPIVNSQPLKKEPKVPFDNNAYMKQYMRDRRAAKKEAA